MDELAIVVVGYNRVRSMTRLLNSLNNARINQSIPLIVSIDNSGRDDVKKVVEDFEWKFGEKHVVHHSKRLGLKKHVLKCGDFTENFENILVLEDDLLVSPYFLDYVNSCIKEYKNDDRIAGIGLYNNIINQNTGYRFEAIHDGYDVYFMQYSCSWGQVWTRNKWRLFKKWYCENSAPFYEEEHIPHNINRWDDSSWLKYHVKYCVDNNKFFVFPRISLTTNFSESGSHSTESSHFFQSPILSGEKNWLLTSIEGSSSVYDVFFENLRLPAVLGIDPKDITIDLYGVRNAQRIDKKYWLTTSIAPYNVVKSYGLVMKPRDSNILYKIEGDDIYLYDMTVRANASRTQRCHKMKIEFRYYIGSINTYGLIWYAFVNLKDRIKYKLRRLFGRKRRQ